MIINVQHEQPPFQRIQETIRNSSFHAGRILYGESSRYVIFNFGTLSRECNSTFAFKCWALSYFVSMEIVDSFVGCLYMSLTKEMQSNEKNIIHLLHEEQALNKVFVNFSNAIQFNLYCFNLPCRFSFSL